MVEPRAATQPQPTPAPSPALKPLPWDSAHFGFPVAQVIEPDLDDEALAGALREARRQGIWLVYWPSQRDRTASPGLLAEFGGLLADRKATFVLPDLTSATGRESDGEAGPVLVAELPRGPASTRLVELAIASGVSSRFRVDPKIPPAKFEAMYATWIDRSTRGDLADAVLVASTPEALGDEAIVGMVTVSVNQGEGRIGLIAVHESTRGRGVGSRLVRSAHRAMHALGAARASVVTQLDNGPACRLYEASGYHLDDVKNYYHFWTTEPEDARPGA